MWKGEKHARIQYLKNTSIAEKREIYRDKNILVKKATRTHKKKQHNGKIQVME